MMQIRILIAQFLPPEGCRGQWRDWRSLPPRNATCRFEDLGERHEQRRGEEHGGQRLDENAEQEVGGVDQQ